MESELEQFVKQNTKYVSFKDANVVEFKFVSASRVVDPFDDKKVAVEYVGEIDGNRVTLTKGSVRLARQMMGKEGKKVRITKEGNGFKTIYIVEVID